jgi:hypothetical protein
MKIQSATIFDPCSLRPRVRLQISDSAEIDDSTEYLTACVTIDREGVALENVELCALDKILKLVSAAKLAVNATTDAIRTK